MDFKRSFCMADLTDAEREAFVNSFPCGRMREIHERMKAEGAYNPSPPSPFNPMEEIKKLSAEIERLKQQQNASTT